jgi:hypothetical protein
MLVVEEQVENLPVELVELEEEALVEILELLELQV